MIASKVYFNPGRLSREAIHREIDGTLKRLGTDYLDLYIIHRFDYETPGLKLGACVTVGAFLLLGVYWLVTRRYDHAHPPKRRTFRVKEPSVEKGEDVG